MGASVNSIHLSSPVSPPITSEPPSGESEEFELNIEDDISSDDEYGLTEEQGAQESTEQPREVREFGQYPMTSNPYPVGEEGTEVEDADDDELPFGPPQLVRQAGVYNQTTSMGSASFSDDDQW